MGYGRPPIGSILERKFGLGPSKLEEALLLQREKGGRLGDLLLRLRAVREEELCEALTGHYQKKGSKPATIRQQRRRAKDALLKAKVLKERDERYYLAI